MVADLDAIYNGLFARTGASADGTKPVIDLIAQEAETCLNASDGINFENKVVLAIATRIAAEQFMIKKINAPTFAATVDANQTVRFLKKFQTLFAANRASLAVLQRVVLMTPENIQLNSFRYEPILDMSDGHLRTLYQEVQVLS